jgi:hypothetical protein
MGDRAKNAIATIAMHTWVLLDIVTMALSSL